MNFSTSGRNGGKVFSGAMNDVVWFTPKHAPRPGTYLWFGSIFFNPFFAKSKKGMVIYEFWSYYAPHPGRMEELDFHAWAE